MFVQSEKFVKEHQGRIDDISIYGQESNQTTWRLCKMNLAIRGIDASQVKWNNEGSFLNDAHPILKLTLSSPILLLMTVTGAVTNCARRSLAIWHSACRQRQFRMDSAFHLSLEADRPGGLVLAKGALTSKTNGESEIRKSLIEHRLIDCIVNLPAKLFLNTQIPAALWFVSRDRTDGSFRTAAMRYSLSTRATWTPHQPPHTRAVTKRHQPDSWTPITTGATRAATMLT
jgi:type I restriction enzyme M protein